MGEMAASRRRASRVRDLYSCRFVDDVACVRSSRAYILVAESLPFLYVTPRITACRFVAYTTREL